MKKPTIIDLRTKKPEASKPQNIDEFLDEIEAYFASIEVAMDNHIKHGIKEDPRPVSCSGCTHPHCCYQKTIVTLYEVFPLVRMLRKTGRDTPELREKLKTIGEEMEGSSPDEWFKKYIPCIFLDNGKCTAYPHRPLRCRTYWVVSPPEDCGPPSGNGVAFINDTPIVNATMATGMRVHQMLKLKETSKRILLAAFPRALLIALEAWDSDDYQDAIRKQVWPSDTTMAKWVDGINPFREKLYQIRKTPAP